MDFFIIGIILAVIFIVLINYVFFYDRKKFRYRKNLPPGKKSRLQHPLLNPLKLFLQQYRLLNRLKWFQQQFHPLNPVNLCMRVFSVDLLHT